MNNFEKWDKEFRAQNLYSFNDDSNGLLWLKVRAICRGKQLSQFLKDNSLTLKSKKVAEQNVELFELLEKRKDAVQMLDEFLRCMNNEWYISKNVDTDKLKEDLYNVHYYVWGGDQNNSLDRYFVNRYVKVIISFSDLENRRNEIACNAWNYVQNSWYNNWTSFLIESLFKRNPRVVSAVGEIKSVDFFIDDYPIDLKVTFFPKGYMDTKLKIKLGNNLLPWLKKQCKKRCIPITKTGSESQQVYTLTEKLSELGHDDIILTLNDVRREIIQEAQNDPTELMVWLYQNQGNGRFGAENRLFLILADSENYEDSWKMKRAFSLIEPKVKEYIDTFTPQSLKPINFIYKETKRKYKALADIIFVVK